MVIGGLMYIAFPLLIIGGIIALVSAIKCFVDENWGEKMHRKSEDAQDMTQDKKVA